MLDKCLYLKVYGERNSGTNFVERLIRTNFAVVPLQSNSQVSGYVDTLTHGQRRAARAALLNLAYEIDCERVRQSDFGWKHGAPPEAEIRSAPHAQHTLFICTMKHPVAWLRSLCQRPYHPAEKVPKDFSRFLRHDWLLARRDNLVAGERVNVVDLWNLKNAAFAKLGESTSQCIVVAYEDILKDPQGFLAKAGRFLAARNSTFVWSLPSTKHDGATFEDYRQKYDQKNIAQMAPPGDLAFIAARADRSLMARFGYEMPVTG